MVEHKLEDFEKIRIHNFLIISQESNLVPMAPPCDKTAGWQPRPIRRPTRIFPATVRELAPDEENQLHYEEFE